MEQDAVVPFIEAAKTNAVADEFIVDLLRHQGWSERRIFAAFSIYYQRTLGVAVPSRGGRFEYARDAFAYLLTFIALAFWTIAAGHIFYVLTDHAFPSGLDPAYAARSLRASVSAACAFVLKAPSPGCAAG